MKEVLINEQQILKGLQMYIYRLKRKGKTQFGISHRPSTSKTRISPQIEINRAWFFRPPKLSVKGNVTKTRPSEVGICCRGRRRCRRGWA